jgi:hypothetical protein
LGEIIYGSHAAGGQDVSLSAVKGERTVVVSWYCGCFRHGLDGGIPRRCNVSDCSDCLAGCGTVLLIQVDELSMLGADDVPYEKQVCEA